MGSASLVAVTSSTLIASGPSFVLGFVFTDTVGGAVLNVHNSNTNDNPVLTILVNAFTKEVMFPAPVSFEKGVYLEIASGDGPLATAILA